MVASSPSSSASSSSSTSPVPSGAHRRRLADVERDVADFCGPCGESDDDDDRVHGAGAAGVKALFFARRINKQRASVVNQAWVRNAVACLPFLTVVVGLLSSQPRTEAAGGSCGGWTRAMAMCCGGGRRTDDRGSSPSAETPITHIRMKLDSESYTKCIERPKNHYSKLMLPSIINICSMYSHLFNCTVSSGTNNGTAGYIIVVANDGLNQMRMEISDMAAVAKLMNATVVIPTLEYKSFWTDPSDFKDIFDVKHFKETLEDDIAILNSLPPAYKRLKHYVRPPTSWARASYYRAFARKLKKLKVVKFTHTDSQIVNHGLPPIQRLRCRANYEALRYKQEIEELGNTLVDRLRNGSNHYIALHLRYPRIQRQNRRRKTGHGHRCWHVSCGSSPASLLMRSPILPRVQ